MDSNRQISYNLRFTLAKRRVDDYIKQLKDVNKRGKTFGLDEFVTFVLADKVLREIPFDYYEAGMPDYLKKQVNNLRYELEKIKDKQRPLVEPKMAHGNTIDIVIEYTKKVVEHADSFKQEVSNVECSCFSCSVQHSPSSKLHQLRGAVRTALRAK